MLKQVETSVLLLFQSCLNDTVEISKGIIVHVLPWSLNTRFGLHFQVSVEAKKINNVFQNNHSRKNTFLRFKSKLINNKV